MGCADPSGGSAGLLCSAVSVLIEPVLSVAFATGAADRGDHFLRSGGFGAESMGCAFWGVPAIFDVVRGFVALDSGAHFLRLAG